MKKEEFFEGKRIVVEPDPEKDVRQGQDAVSSEEIEEETDLEVNPEEDTENNPEDDPQGKSEKKKKGE